MMQLNAYVFFPGTCEAALHFYEGVFGGKITSIMRFKDAPQSDEMPANREGVMHATFEAPGLTFMASDGMETWPMAGVSLSLATEDVAEGERVFNALADGGEITVPYTKQFWGATFGMLRDRFGVRWMVNAG